jgi:GNAT superfamily N-acetyltransferase
VARLHVRPLEERDVEACATLLAGRHARARQRLLALPERFEQPNECEALVRQILARDRVSSAVAEFDGTLAGYLIGQANLQAADSFAAQFDENRTVHVPLAGHAVSPGEDAATVYNRLYATLAEQWVDQGLFAHGVALPHGDAELGEAWNLLGFGAKTAFAVRDTRPLERPPPARTVDVRRATPEDGDVVGHFFDLEARFHRQSPILWPYLALDTGRASRAFREATLKSDENAVFLAFRGSRPVAMLLFLAGAGFGPPMTSPDRCVYLFEGITEPEARGGGTGGALLDHAFGWARDEGYGYCTLHYATANPSGRPFWLGHGWEPYEDNWVRHVDERVAWARPSDG